jgi:hypothetical protein
MFEGMATKKTTRVLGSLAIGGLALGLTAPAASAHNGSDDKAEGGHRNGHHSSHRGYAWGHAALKAPRVVVDENAGTATVTLRLNKKAPADATFTWTTLDKNSTDSSRVAARRGGSEHSGGNKAVAGTDYTATAGTVTIAAGTRSVSVVVPILDDTAIEKDETFLVRFKATQATTASANRAAHRAGKSHGWCAGAKGRATAKVVIADND